MGDLVLACDNAGIQVGALRSYSPFGEPLATTGAVDSDNVPDNQPGQLDYGWLGQHQRPYEHAGALSIVEMGARPYSPLLGRFLTVDAVEGGSANDYDYVVGDPINATDLGGDRYHRRYHRSQYHRAHPSYHRSYRPFVLGTPLLGAEPPLRAVTGVVAAGVEAEATVPGAAARGSVIG